MTGLKLIFLSLVLLYPGIVWPQVTPEKTRPPWVRNLQGADMANAWAGGMNSCQFGKIDLNLDGRKDLVVFDRLGDRIMPFINNGGVGEIDYEYRAEFAAAFPALGSWMILTDYNGDGKEDIFSYAVSWPGIVVFKNISSGILQFEQVVSPYLTSFQGGIYTNILVTYADYPGIADLDGDGDLDILTFWGLGSFIELHRNLSVEKYGHSDSLDYEKVSYCWGFIAESEESNVLTLDTCIGWRRGAADEPLMPHTGSTFLLTDLQGDGLQDVLLGDVDYPNLIALYNDGTKDTAHISAYDAAFPTGDVPVNLFSMPASAYLDINNDGISELLVSPFDPNPAISENKFSSWLYLNNGTTELPDLHLTNTDFLQETMIDVGAGAWPVLADYDGDHILDLFIGNYGCYDSSFYDDWMILHTVQTGRIALFKNTGSASQPSFTIITDDFASASDLHTVGIVPAFGDMDGDGDMDMLTGQENGRLILFENTAGTGNPMLMQMVTGNFSGIDVGDFSAPQLFDLDRDGVPDLVLGEREGNINFYKSSPGSPWMNFIFVTDSLGGINVTNPNISLDGYSIPHLFRDSLDRSFLAVGSEDGKIFLFDGIDGNIMGKFTESDSLGAMTGQADWNADRGYRTAAAMADLDGDLQPELLAGNWSGGLEYFSSSVPPAVMHTGEPGNLSSQVRIYPNPARDWVTIRLEKENEFKISRTELYDARGALIMANEHKMSSSSNLNLANLENGIYFLRIVLASAQGNYSIINKKLALFK